MVRRVAGPRSALPFVRRRARRKMDRTLGVSRPASDRTSARGTPAGSPRALHLWPRCAVARRGDRHAGLPAVPAPCSTEMRVPQAPRESPAAEASPTASLQIARSHLRGAPAGRSTATPGDRPPIRKPRPRPTPRRERAPPSTLSRRENGAHAAESRHRRSAEPGAHWREERHLDRRRSARVCGFDACGVDGAEAIGPGAGEATRGVGLALHDRQTALAVALRPLRTYDAVEHFDLGADETRHAAAGCQSVRMVRRDEPGRRASPPSERRPRLSRSRR